MSDAEYSDYEDLKACMQCAQLSDSLLPCEGGCGRDLCPYCQPKCKECVDHETYKQIKEEKKEEKRRKGEAQKKGYQPERTLGEKVWRAMDWVFGFADGALRRELEYYEGEFDMYDNEEDIQEMMKARWKSLPEWKKKIYRAKKKTENLALKTVLKVGMTGGHIIGQLGSPGGPEPDYSTLGKEEDYQDFKDDDLNDEFEDDEDEEGDDEFDEEDDDIEDDVDEDEDKEDDDEDLE